MGLGPYPAVSLAKARDRAEQCRQQVADDLDPIAERGKEARVSFGAAGDAFYEAMNHEWSHSKTHYKWHRAMNHHCAPIRERPVVAVDTGDILKVLNPIWLIRSETASNLRSQIERVLDFAKAKGWRGGENPARWRGHLQNILPKPPKLTQGHLPAMDYSAVPAFMAILKHSEAMAARALDFTILTAARSGEALNAQWSEIDFDACLWTVPAVRMKSRIEHRAPLSCQALDLLETLYENRISDYIFPGQKPNRPLSARAMKILLGRLEITDATVHGFRSSFRDWCGEETHFPREIAEAALAHKVGNEVERAYRRGDALEKRRHLMQAWADFITDRATGNVVAMRPGTKA